MVRASTPTPETHVYRGPTPHLSTIRDHIAKLEREALDSAGVPRYVLMGTPSGEHGLYHDYHVDARKYAIGFDTAGDSVMVVRMPSSPKAPAASCPGCAALVFFTANDCLQRHYHSDRTPCAWSGRQRATVEHEQSRMASPPKPPTLREWLGDRVGELGRWADVLREQPVPAGDVSAWKWEMFGSEWHLEYQSSAWRARLSRNSVRDAVTGDCDPWELDADTLQMALFTRHPDVKPEPKPAAFPWDPYPEVI